MICDELVNAAVYEGVHPRLRAAFHFLRQPGLDRLPLGEYEIDGRNVYAIVQEYTTRTRAEGLWEAHRRYIDVQYVNSSAEQMGVASVSSMRVTRAYDEASDSSLFEPANGAAVGEFFVLRAGTFCVLMPHEAHMPGQALAEPQPVRKVVVKVRV